MERLIGTIRREYLDRILFWTTADLEAKLIDFHITITAIERMRGWKGACRNRLREERYHQLVGSYRWRRHCRGLYQTPIAA